MPSHAPPTTDGATPLRQDTLLTLRGAPGTLVFPPLCPNCGAQASQRITVTKVFTTEADSETPERRYLVSAAVPFCDECLAKHSALEQRQDWFTQLREGLASMDILGAVFPALAALFVLHLALGDLMHGKTRLLLVYAVVGGVFALIAWLQTRAVWSQSEHLRVPVQTAVTTAFDFSADVSRAFEPARFICTLRDAAFAQAFSVLNAERLWQRDSEQAVTERRSAKRKFWVVGAVVVAAGIWGLIDDWFG